MLRAFQLFFIQDCQHHLLIEIVFLSIKAVHKDFVLVWLLLFYGVIPED